MVWVLVWFGLSLLVSFVVLYSLSRLLGNHYSQGRKATTGFWQDCKEIIFLGLWQGYEATSWVMQFAWQIPRSIPHVNELILGWEF
jgi:hypothetical protein